MQTVGEAKMEGTTDTDHPSTSAHPAAAPIRHIAWSARILAATRAEESERTVSPPLVVDPLAARLAHPNNSTSSSDSTDEYGDRRMWLHHTHFHFRRIKDKADPAEVARLQAEADELNRDKAERPDTLIRCRYIDQLVAATIAASEARRAAAAESEQDQPAPFRQLVLLGAGLDTRAYRCECLAGVRVYEVDRAEVLAYKQAVLQQSSASLKAPSVEHIVGELSMAVEGVEAVVSDTGAYTGKVGAKKGKRREKAAEELDLSKARDRRALQAIELKRSKQQHAETKPASQAVDISQQPATSLSSAAIDTLSAPAWSTALLASSTFDSSLPTIWVLEGLCMYLTPSQLSSLLRTAASLCPPSSVLCFDHVTAKLGRWHRLFSSALSREDCVRLVESACLPSGGWRVGERRGREVRVGYEAGDGVVGIGRDELSYGRYLRDALAVEAGNGRQIEVQSYIVTAVRQPD